jgi:hypothetical protein
MPFSTVPENIIKKYLGVKALAERGATDGERTAALRALKGLEERYPTVRIEAELYESMERGEGPAADEPPRQRRPNPPPPTPDPNYGPYTASNGNWGGAESRQQSTPPPPAAGTPPPGGRAKWGNWGDILGQAWEVARDITENAVNTEAGRLHADQSCVVEFTQTAAGNVRITAVSPIQALMAAKYRFNDAQKQAFAKRVGEKVAEKVYAFLTAP